jgi:prepilin-type N-terminal cleavage/methylation domain-containing protein
MKQKLKIGRGFTLVELLVVIVIIAALAGLTAPMVIRQRKKADQTEAVNNAKQIGLAMFEFENEYGTYPGAKTLVQLNENFSSSVIKGAAGPDSNGYFKQLMQAGFTESEAMFFAKSKGSKKPDGKITLDTDALATGEVGFAYITDADEGMSSAGNPARAICVTPMNAAGDKFDGNPFDKKAVILRIDNSASSVNISVPAGTTDNTGDAISAGASIIAPTNAVWNGVVPKVRPPKQ